LRELKISSNLLVKFSNIIHFPTPIALVGEPSLTSVDPFVSKGTAKPTFAGIDGKLHIEVQKVNK